MKLTTQQKLDIYRETQELYKASGDTKQYVQALLIADLEKKLKEEK